MNEAEESGYRTKPYVPPALDEPPGLHEGPRFKCPGCGMPAQGKIMRGKREVLAIPVGDSSGPQIPRACQGRRWWWPFGCRRADVHLHQACGTCGSKWVVGPVEESDT